MAHPGSTVRAAVIAALVLGSALATPGVAGAGEGEIEPTSEVARDEPTVSTEAERAPPPPLEEHWLSGSEPSFALASGTFTVTPSAGLGYTTPVTVVGSGYTPNRVFGFLQCVAGATGFDGCGSSTLRVTGTDGAGAVSGSTTARRFLAVAGATVDCATAPGTCVIGAGHSLGDSLVNTVPLTFDPNAPIPPDPTITVAPSIGLGLVTQVTITGSGFDPGEAASILPCVAGATDLESGCSQFGSGWVEADGSGAIQAEMQVRRGIRTNDDPVVDCLDPPGCEIVATPVNDLARRGRAPLAFDATVPLPPPPVLTATPTTGLADRQLVSAIASGFAPGDEVFAGQCVESTTSPATCGPVQYFRADENGAVAFSFRARRLIGAPPVDCQNAPGTCKVFAASFHDVFATTSLPLAFDPNAPAVAPPTFGVSPSTGLRDGDAVTVFGHGFASGEQVAIVQCRVGLPDDSGGNCDLSATLRYVNADSAGEVHTTFTVRRSLRTRNFGDVDCAWDTHGCVVSWGGFADLQFERGNVPLHFEPDAIVVARRSVGGRLPATGATTVPLVTLGAGMCLLGLVLLVCGRRPGRSRLNEPL